MCLFLQFSEREISHKTLPPFSQQKRKEEEEEKTWWKKVNLSSVVGYTFMYMCVKRACVYTRGDVTTTRQNCVSEKSNGRLFYLGFTSDTLNKTSSHGRRQKKKKTTTQSIRKGEHEEEDEHSRAVLEDESLSLSLSFCRRGSSKSSSLRTLYKGKIYAMNESSENDLRRTTPTEEEKKDETNAKKTTNAKKEKPKSARGAPPRRQNKEDVFGDGFNARRGGGGKEAGFVPPPPLKQQKEQKEKQKKGTTQPRVPRRANDAKKKNWWKELPEEKCDPITLEPFCEQTHAPFELLGKKFKREQSYSSLLNDEEEDDENAEAAARMMTTTTIQTSEEQLQVKHLFDPESLAEYVVNAKTFENPLTREALDASDCQRLDEHLRKFSLKKFSVHRAYVNLQKEKKDELENAERRTEEQRARMQREREELRRTLASSMFTSIRERRQGENSSSGRNHHHQQQNGNSNSSNRNATSTTTNMNNSNSEASAQQALAANLETSIEQQENAFRAFGAFAMVDDDIAMSRGQTLRAAQTSFSGWSNPEAIRRHGSNSNIPLSSAENFPSLGSGSGSSTTRIGTGGWSRMAQRASSLHDDDGGSVVGRPRVQPPPPTQTISSSSEPPANHHEKQRERQREAEFAAAALPNDSVNADEARRAQLAAAFGISNPDSHVSAFAVSGAKSAFKQEHLKAAKNNPRLCAQIEQKFEEMARDANNRRATFPPMTKFLRGVVHEYAALWGFTSQSYGNEPNRRVDVFRTTACKKPTINLREAILAHDELKKEKEEKDRMMMMMATTTTSNGVGGSSTPSSMNQPPEDANEDEYFPGFTSYHTKRNGGVEYERLTATFSDGADKKTLFLMLRPWAGQFAVEVDEKESGDFDDAEYIAHFKNPEALKKASGVIGGGVKGKFKVKYSEKIGGGLLTRQSQLTDKANQQQSSSSSSNEFEKESISSVVSPPPKIFELRRKKKP